MARLGADRVHGGAGHRRFPVQPVAAHRRRYFPRLRWAARHPRGALERSGFGLWTAGGPLMFTAGVLAWLTWQYVSHFS